MLYIHHCLQRMGYTSSISLQASSFNRLRFWKKPDRIAKAFTLSELLVSLSVIGLISAITLPVIFNSVSNHRRKAVFRETIQVMAEVSIKLADEGDDFSTLEPFLTGINLQKGCYTTEPDCMSTTTIGSYNDPRGGVFYNGSIFWDLEPIPGGSQGYDNIAIDWNGHAGPNVEGKDILIVARCVNPAASSYPCVSQMAADKVHTGNVDVNNTRPLSLALWDEIY